MYNRYHIMSISVRQKMGDVFRQRIGSVFYLTDQGDFVSEVISYRPIDTQVLKGESKVLLNSYAHSRND